MAEDAKQYALDKHREWQGKIEVITRAPITSPEELAVAYTPGVAEPCLKISENVEDSYTYTRRGNLVAVVTDGTAVLGLGDIGPEAGMPVMEGKCALFKTFADVDAFPLCVRSKDVDEIVRTVELVAGSFGGINLEDISAPRCFEIERRLKECCDIPVFHDDQHGTAVVTCAALINACRLTGRDLADVRVVFSGAGAAGISIAKLMQRMGVKDVIICDRTGAIYEGREGLNPEKAEIATWTNREGVTGTLADAVKGADVFVGVSAPGVLTQDMVRTMAADPIIFACANPVPEIMPDEALAAGAAVLPQPDQQRARVPGHLPRRPRRARVRHQRRHDGGRGLRDRRPRRRRAPRRRLHHPRRLRRARGACRRRRRGRGRPHLRRRPPLVVQKGTDPF